MPLQGCSQEAIRAYAAGLIDGEGSISAPASCHNRRNFRVCVHVAMCDPEAIEFLAQNFGGKTSIEKRRTATGKMIYKWSIYCRNAADFLEVVLPYLLVKRERARLAIQLAGMMRTRRTSKTVPITDDETAQRSHLASAIRQANFGSNGRIARYAAA